MRALALILALSSAPALAVSPNGRFDNQLASPLVVSPAQIYVVRQRDLRLEAGLESEKTRASVTEPGGISGSVATGRGSRVFGSAVVAAEDKHLRLGVEAEMATAQDIVRTTGEDTMTKDGKTSRVAPVLALELDPVVFGARAAVVQESVAASASGTARTATSIRIDMGALFQISTLEAGFAYTPRARARVATEAASSDLPDTVLATAGEESLPATIRIHGRGRIGQTATLGMQYAQTELSRLETESSYVPRAKDRRTVTLTSELGFASARLEGTLAYSGATHPEIELATPDTIARLGGTGGAFLKLDNVASLGITLAGDHSESKGLARDRFSASLSGALSF